MDQVVIRNHSAHESIDPRFLPLVEAAKAGMLACCGNRVRELRLQGSIPRGDARVVHADLDMVALLEGPPTDTEHQCLAKLTETLAASATLVSRFDLEAVNAVTLEPFRRFVLSSDSVCVYGTDSLTVHVQSMERHALAQLIMPGPATMLPDYLQWVEELANAADAERLFTSRIIGKDLLKVLRGVLLLRGAPYEVAIPRIAAQVPHVAPEATGVAEQLLAFYAEPTTDLNAIRRAVAEAAMMLERHPELALLPGGRDTDPAHSDWTN